MRWPSWWPSPCRAECSSPASVGSDALAQQLGVAGQVDVATADDHAHPQALQGQPAMVGAGQAEGAGGLDHQLHALGIKAHGFDQLRVADGQDVTDIAADDAEGELSQVLGLGAVGNRCAVAMCTTSPRRSDCWPSLPASGSTPYTRQSGDRALAASALPASRPPPPRQTSSTSSGPTSSNNSLAAVPWPVITSAWSNGGIRVMPRSAAMRRLMASRSSL